MEDELLKDLEVHAHTILESNNEVYQHSISQAKDFLDSLTIIASNPVKSGTALPIYITDFDVDQIWEQARVLLQQVSRSVYFGSRKSSAPNPSRPNGKRKRDDDDDDDLSLVSDESISDESGSFLVNPEVEFESAAGNLKTDEGIRLRTATEDSLQVKDSHMSDMAGEAVFDDFDNKEDGDSEDMEANIDNQQSRFVKEVDDEFFSIIKFNRDTEEFERADELGRPVDENDTEIDWNADPGDELDDTNFSDVTEEDTDRADEGGGGIMYNDFFAAPRTHYDIHGQPPRSSRPLNRGESGDELVDIVERMRRDLFEEGEQEGFDGLENDTETSGNGYKTESSHARRQAALDNQIRMLEKQNISQREWMLSGEARAQQRPFNSLLEEDLDFERTGKAVPVITQEITISLEELIKVRILSGNFDDIPRKQPASFGPTRRAARSELEDSKSKVSLAQLYENEHLQTIDPDHHLTKKDSKLEALKNEVSLLFSSISNQLDSLSSWQFTPKTAQPSLSVVHDVRAISMEEANLNTGALSVSTTTTLAPHEIYNPLSSQRPAGERIGKSGAPISVSEMTREQKAKGRRQRRIQKKGAAIEANKGPASSEVRLLKDLQAANVSIIGKHGERSNLSGQSIKTKPLSSSGTEFKL